MPANLDPVSLLIGASLIAATVLLLGWFVVRTHRARAGELTDAVAVRTAEVEELRRRVGTLSEENARLAERATRVERLEQELREAQAALERARAAQQGAERHLAALQSRQDEQQRATEQRIRDLQATRERLGAEFKALAGEVLDEKSRKFGEQNLQQLGQVLNPLREDLGGFRRLVSESFEKEGQGRVELKTELQHLRELNRRLSEDADALSRALTTDTRTQGYWGELRLERLLEASGLTRGLEYEMQVGLRDDEGQGFRPDVIVRLPEGRDVVIDAKVSLTAYQRFCAATTEAERGAQLDQHLVSLRGHMRTLGGKNYAGLEGVRTLDYVLMFVPVETAFIDAVRADDALFDEALRLGIVIVSPSTLLATLRTIANLWKVDKQNRNARKIAARAGKLLDKFTGFVDDLEEVGKALGRARDAHEGAVRKLASGRGNLLRQTEMLRELGADASKALPTRLGSDEEDDDEDAGEAATPNDLE
ncbi:MAG TPA: DNA recombination protein RmuC [Xanthomonadaceae bacterium]|nr:DNA recombination protein RmuC [Xanthomonadaceae bacterium]